MSEALGPKWTARLQARRRAAARADRHAAARRGGVLPQDDQVVWQIIETMFSDAVITPGVDAHRGRRVVDAPAGERSRARHVVPAVRRGAAQGRDRRAARRRSDHPARRRAALRLRHHRVRLNTDTQHMGYVLLPARRTRRPGSRRRSRTPTAAGHRRWRRSRPGRTGNEILARVAARMKARGNRRHGVLASDRHERPRRRPADRSVGLSGRRPRPRRREGDPEHVVLDRAAGDDAGARVGRPAVRMAQEEDVVVGADGVARWAFKRQTELHVVRPTVQ